MRVIGEGADWRSGRTSLTHQHPKSHSASSRDGADGHKILEVSGGRRTGCQAGLLSFRRDLCLALTESEGANSCAPFFLLQCGRSQFMRLLWSLRVRVIVLAALGLLPAPPGSSQTPAQRSKSMPTPQAHPFPHFWEKMFGSGRAILTLRESYRNDLRETKRITGFEYVRFHAIFHDEVGVYDEDALASRSTTFLMWIRSMTDCWKTRSGRLWS